MNNYCLIRLLYSPISPFLIGFILCLILKNFDSELLCDSENIDKLKNDLNAEIIKYNEVIEGYKFWREWDREALKSPIPDLKTYIFTGNKCLEETKEAGEIFKKIKRIERMIVRSEPSFNSSFEGYNFNKPAWAPL
jgi:hypothetical protein